MWKSRLACSEAHLKKMATEMAAATQTGDRIILEGALGAGKSTFARALLDAWRIEQPAAGSPTFPLMHVYSSPMLGSVAHIDFYRLKSESEIFDSGIEECMWTPGVTVICEWLSIFPDFESAVYDRSPDAKSIWKVELSVPELSCRDIQITLFQRHSKGPPGSGSQPKRLR